MFSSFETIFILSLLLNDAADATDAFAHADLKSSFHAIPSHGRNKRKPRFRSDTQNLFHWLIWWMSIIRTEATTSLGCSQICDLKIEWRVTFVSFVTAPIIAMGNSFHWLIVADVWQHLFSIRLFVVALDKKRSLDTHNLSFKLYAFDDKKHVAFAASSTWHSSSSSASMTRCWEFKYRTAMKIKLERWWLALSWRFMTLVSDTLSVQRAVKNLFINWRA